MLSVLGRLLQICALILLPLAMLMEMTDFLGRDFYVSDMVIMLLFGIALFVIGRFMEGHAAGGHR